jgi:hypothetical protein
MSTKMVGPTAEGHGLFPPVQQQRTFPGALANKRVDGIGVRGVDEHAHRAVGIERIARLPVAGLRFQLCQEVIGDALSSSRRVPAIQTCPWL